MLHGSESGEENELTLPRAEMTMIRWVLVTDRQGLPRSLKKMINDRDVINS